MNEGFVVVFVMLHCLSTSAAIDFNVVDLTHAHSNSTIYWPGNPDYEFTILSRGQTSAGYWYESNFFGTAEHGGTHLDSPAHFYENRKRTQEIPLEKLIGPGVIIDVKSKARANPDYRVSVSDVEEWESRFGQIPKGAVVIMNSGWHAYYPNKTLVFNTQTPADPSTFHFPAWHEDAVTWLINKRSIHVLGVDTPSTDYGQSTTFPVHVILGKANVPGAENVANLDAIPNVGSIIFVAVTKIYDGSGGPARVFATIPTGTSAGITWTSFSFVYVVLFAILIKYA